MPTIPLSISASERADRGPSAAKCQRSPMFSGSSVCLVGAGVPDGPFARLCDVSRPVHHPRACAFRYAEREGERNCGLALPVADSAMPQFPQRSKNARSSTSPKRFSGTARWIGRPQTTLDDIPANFLRHYPAYKNGAFNLMELARLCDISRTTAYKYIGLLEG